MNRKIKYGFDAKRRRFVQGLTTGGMLASLGLISPSVLAAKPAMKEVNILDGPIFDLTIDEVMVNFTGQLKVLRLSMGQYQRQHCVCEKAMTSQFE